MGKGYNNYMCKKPFHPGSKANIKRAWMAEQKTENDKRKQEELKVQYEKEQDLYNNRALISSESKDKLELNFMYEAPPGAKRERQKEDDEPEYKFEWQRKYNAPREDYARGNEDIKDQPFGIPVRNVRCIKCHKWGHINTDKECPLYSQASTSSMPTTSMDPMELMRQMREDGYGLKENVLGHHLNPKAANQQLIPSDESDPEMDFLKSLSTAEKKKLLRKLKKLSKKQEKKKKSKKSRKSKAKESSDTGSEKDKKKKKKKQRESSSSSSDSSGDESIEHKKGKKRKQEFSASKVKSSSTNREERSPSNETKKQKHRTQEKSDHGGKSHSETKATKTEHSRSDQERTKESKHKSKTEESSASKKDATNVSSKKEYKESDKNNVKPSWKSSYSSSSSENDEANKKAEKYSKESKATKHKAEEQSTGNEGIKRIKIEKSDSDKGPQIVSSDKPKHPDGFSHLCPQAKIDANYLVAKVEYKGKIHDEFRHHYRDDRSPSVKQKYNK